VKLTRSFRNVLTALSMADERSPYVLANHLPDGNGMQGGASGVKLREMKRAGLVEYGKNAHHSHYGYRITDAGRAALAEQKDRER